jgi:Ca2+-binding EF-hand superfamily protein
VDKVEFRNVVRSFGFECRDALIDKLFARFDLQSTGELSLGMVSRRLQAEMNERESRGRRMAELRCLQWRVSAKVVQLIDPVALDPKLSARAGARSRILGTLRAQQARVMDLFRSWDADGDALISKTEFRQAVLVLGLDGVPRKQVDELFDELDKDGSGEISFNEMRDAIKGPEETAPVEDVGNQWKGWGAEAKHAAALTLSDKGRGASIVRGIRLSPDYDLIAQLTHGLATNWGRVTWLFQTWDTDRNGTISRLELRKALGELGLGEHPRAVDSLFDAIDANRSGAITLDEFQLALQASLRAAQSEQLMDVSRGIAPAAFPRRSLPAVSGAVSPEPSPRNRVGKFGQWSSTKPNVLVLPPMRRPIELMKTRRSRNASPEPRNSSPERVPAFDPIPTPPITARPTVSHRRHILRPHMRLQALDRVPLIALQTTRHNPTTVDAATAAALVPQTRIRRSRPRHHLI